MASTDAPSRTKTAQAPSEQPHRKRIECVDFFDKAWFCYTPAHQLTTMYRTGNIDSCQESVQNLYRCLVLKARPDAEMERQLLFNKVHHDDRHHIWTVKDAPE